MKNRKQISSTSFSYLLFSSLLLLVLIPLSGAAFSARTHPANKGAARGSLPGQTSEKFRVATAGSSVLAGPMDQASEEQIEVESITIGANGFEPREITRRHGSFMLAISNHSGAAELALRLDRVQGSRVHEVRLRKGRVRWNQIFDLPPGDYLLTEENHPDWTCHIQLTSQ